MQLFKQRFGTVPNPVTSKGAAQHTIVGSGGVTLPEIPLSTGGILVMFCITPMFPRSTMFPKHLGILQGKKSMRKMLNKRQLLLITILYKAMASMDSFFGCVIANVTMYKVVPHDQNH